MPLIKAEVDALIKKRFHRKAKESDMTESELLRAVVMVIIDDANDDNLPVAVDLEKSDTERVRLRLPRFLMDAVREKAKAKGMAPNRWLGALVQSNLTKQPVMSDAELMALQASSRELAAIGRNINQMAKALNEAFYETERVRLDKLDELSRAIKANRATIRALVRVSQHVWEVDV